MTSITYPCGCKYYLWKHTDYIDKESWTDYAVEDDGFGVEICEEHRF